MMRLACGRLQPGSVNLGWKSSLVRAGSSPPMVPGQSSWNENATAGYPARGMRQESAMKLKIVVLEDNADRADLMRSYLEDRFHTYESYFFDSAAEMLKYLETHWNEIIVI